MAATHLLVWNRLEAILGPLAALPASRTSLLSLVGVPVHWPVQLRADSLGCLLTQSQI